MASALRMSWSGSHALFLAWSVNALGPSLKLAIFFEYNPCGLLSRSRSEAEGEQMVQHRSVDDFRPTAMNLAEVEGLRVKLVSWISALEMSPSDQ